MITLDQVLAELRRELGMRRSLYPRWVAQGKLTQATADHRIEAIERTIEIIEEHCPLEQGNRKQLSLFGGES